MEKYEPGALCSLLFQGGRFDGGRKCVRRDDAASSAVATAAALPLLEVQAALVCDELVEGGVG